MLRNPLITTYLRMRLLVIMPVAVEKLAPEKSAKIKPRQEALQTIFFDHLDISYPGISTCLRKKGGFQQSRLFSTSIPSAPVHVHKTEEERFLTTPTSLEKLLPTILR
jgi:hypothetical protein